MRGIAVPGSHVFYAGAVGALLPLSYTYFWLWSEPIWLLLQIAVALEVHTKMWKDHRLRVASDPPVVALRVLDGIAGGRNSRESGAGSGWSLALNRRHAL